MKYFVLTGAVTQPHEGIINLSHDFGRPVNLISIRIISFTYPFNAADTHIGQWLFTLNGTSLSIEDKHRSCINVGGELAHYTWGCQSTILTGQKGVFQHDFSTNEQDTRIVPRTPVFTNQIILTCDYKTLEQGKAHTWPTPDAGWDFSVTLEIVEE